MSKKYITIMADAFSGQSDSLQSRVAANSTITFQKKAEIMVKVETVELSDKNRCIKYKARAGASLTLKICVIRTTHHRYVAL